MLLSLEIQADDGFSPLPNLLLLIFSFIHTLASVNLLNELQWDENEVAVKAVFIALSYNYRFEFVLHRRLADGRLICPTEL